MFARCLIKLSHRTHSICYTMCSINVLIQTDGRQQHVATSHLQPSHSLSRGFLQREIWTHHHIHGLVRPESVYISAIILMLCKDNDNIYKLMFQSTKYFKHNSYRRLNIIHTKYRISVFSFHAFTENYNILKLK